MPKVYTPKQVLVKLKKLGFIEDRQSGSHIVLIEPESKRRAVTPFHLKQLPKRTLSSILREMKISKKTLNRLNNSVKSETFTLGNLSVCRRFRI